jgi:hypothetical protein
MPVRPTHSGPRLPELGALTAEGLIRVDHPIRRIRVAIDGSPCRVPVTSSSGPTEAPRAITMPRTAQEDAD